MDGPGRGADAVGCSSPITSAWVGLPAVPSANVGGEIRHLVGLTVEAQFFQNPGEVVCQGLALSEYGQQAPGSGVNERFLCDEPCVDVVQEQGGSRRQLDETTALRRKVSLAPERGD